MSARYMKCRSCGASIFFAPTEKGTTMPLDAFPANMGNIVLIEGMACVVPSGSGEDNVKRYTCHFATCPFARTHRSSRA